MQRFVSALQHAHVHVEDTEVWNWSATHSSGPHAIVLAPDNIDACRAALRYLANQKDHFRLLGAGNSPNGHFLAGTMLSMEHLNELELRPDTVKVGAGTTVGQILDALKGRTLDNFSSISSQQAGGWTQMAAHGTGARLPTVDDMIEELTLMTPSGLEATLTRNHPWFPFAAVGLGYLGAVTSLVLRTMPTITLHEKTEVMTHAAVRQGHEARLCRHRHVRYMWIPHTKYCVVVTSNPHDASHPASAMQHTHDTSAMRALDPTSRNWDFAFLREHVLRPKVMDVDHVRRVNEAEVEYWKTVSDRIGPTNDILGFECGGQQLVLEICFKVSLPCEDIDFVLSLLQRIESDQIAAPGPIEQRWTCGSANAMSPSHGAPEELFSWVGIIMYLCNDAKNEEIRRAFDSYAQATAELGRLHGCVPHWAKLDYGINWKPFLWRRYKQLQAFDAIREACDPEHLLGVAPWRFG